MRVIVDAETEQGDDITVSIDNTCFQNPGFVTISTSPSSSTIEIWAADLYKALKPFLPSREDGGELCGINDD
jgi:hypothetical protein